MVNFSKPTTPTELQNSLFNVEIFSIHHPESADMYNLNTRAPRNILVV